MTPYSIDKSRRNYTRLDRPRYASLDGLASERIERNRIKVVTYNIKYAKKIDRAINFLAKNDDLHNAEILCLQEMDFKGVEAIASHLKYNYIYYPSVVHPRYGRDFGNAVLSKYPIIEDQKVILPHLDNRKLQRIAVSATISLNGKKVIIFCVHVKVFLKASLRTIQMDEIIKSVPKDIKHCVVAGDFNTFTKANYDATLRPFMDAGFDLATEDIDWTYKHWYLFNKKTSLDHIFTRGMKVHTSDKVVYRKPSDHIPIWAEVEVT